jgi:hypothetical protein
MHEVNAPATVRVWPGTACSHIPTRISDLVERL